MNNLNTIHNLPTTTTFFEYVGIAGLERLNSQIIAWVFAGDNKILTPEEQVRLLNRVFEPKVASTAINAVLTEDRYVDIIIEAEPRVVVIENKLKAGERDRQLETYEEHIKNLSDYKERAEFFFLTLIGDMPRSSKSWRPVEYDRLFKELESILKTKVERGEITEGNGYDYLLLKGYVGTMNRTLNAKKLFLNNHSHGAFERVFSDGGKKKRDKQRLVGNFDASSVNDEFAAMDCIARMNLETAFQRLLYRTIFRRIEEIGDYMVEESHGAALVSISNLYGFDHDGERYVFGVQFQRNGVKIILEVQNCFQKRHKIEPFLQNDFFKKLGQEHGYRKYNKPRPKGNGYVSVSRKLVRDGRWFAGSGEELTELFRREVTEGFRVIEAMAPIVKEYARSLPKNDKQPSAADSQ